MKQAIRQPLRVLRHVPDQVLHTYRRRRAQVTLEGRSVRSVLFVCHGNINRSAYAAATFVRLLPESARERVAVSSAGFIGGGRPASELAQVVAARRQLDLGAHVSRLLDPEELRSVDLIVVMNTSQRGEICRLSGRSLHDVVVLGDLDPDPIQRRTVQDPYGHAEDVFEQVFDRIDRCVVALVGALVPHP